MTDVTNGSTRPGRIDRSMARLDRRVEAANLRPWRYPSGRDALTAAVSYSIPDAAKGAISLSGDDTEGVWRSYEKIPEVWAPLNYLARAIQQIELVAAVHQPGESAPVPLEEVDKTLAAAAGRELDRLRSATGGFERILFSAAIQFLVPGKGFFVADQDDDGEDVLLVCSTSEVRRKPGGADDQFERQVDAKRWKTVEGWVTGIRRPHARYSWKAHSSLYALQGACDEVLLLDRMYRSNARSRIGRGVLMAPREAEFRPLRPNRTNPEQDTLAFTLMKILTAAVTEEDSALNVAPAVLELKGDFIEKFRHVTFGEALDDKVAARYDRQLDRIAAGIDLPAALAKGLEDTNHWSAWAITDDAFDQYAAPICELICSSLTTAFLWPALEASKALGEGAARPVIWYDPFRLRAKPPEGEEIDKAFDRGALSWAGYRNLRSIDEDDAPDDEELDRRAELGLLKGAGGGGQPSPTAVTQSPVQSRTAAEPDQEAGGGGVGPKEASVQADGFDEDAHPRGPDGKFGDGSGSGGGAPRVLDDTGGFSGSADQDWRRMENPEARAAAAWSHQYDEMNAIREEIAGNPQPSLSPRQEGRGLRDFNEKTGEYEQRWTREEYRSELSKCAETIRGLPVVARDEPLLRGMRVDDAGMFSPGAQITLDKLTSFTPQADRARLYTKEDARYRTGKTPVLVTLREASTRRLDSSVMTGSQRGAVEDLFTGRIEVRSVTMSDQGVLEVEAHAV